MASPAEEQTPDAGGVYVPGPRGWVPAPPGWVPPVGWIPTTDGWRPAPPGWTPPPWWVRTPSGYLPPPAGRDGTRPLVTPSGEPDGATRLFGWTRVLPRTLQRAAQIGDRKPSGWEIWVVLAVFPATAVVSALISLAQTLSDFEDGSAHAPTIVPHHAALSTVLFVLLVVTELAPAALVAYLMKMSGGGLRALGLDRSEVRTDLARTCKLALYAYPLELLVVAGAFGVLTPHHDLAGKDQSGLPVAYLLPFVLSAITAGVVEEIVVLGYLVHRLEQRGWSGWRLYAATIAVRISYHLYYGTAVIGFAVWAGVSVLLYRRRRRLLPFIVAHALWDSCAFVSLFLHGAVAVVPYGVALAVLVLLWGWGRESAVREMKDSGRALAERREELPEMRVARPAQG